MTQVGGSGGGVRGGADRLAVRGGQGCLGGPVCRPGGDGGFLAKQEYPFLPGQGEV